jgi:transposase
MTAWRRLEAWQKRGVWKKVHERLLARLQGADKIDWSRVVVDSSSIRALHGGKKRGVTQQIVGGKGASTTLRPTRTAFRSRPR